MMKFTTSRSSAISRSSSDYSGGDDASVSSEDDFSDDSCSVASCDSAPPAEDRDD